MADKGLKLANDIPSYEDESLVAMDPRLIGFDEDEDIDLLNDDTFGSGAVVDDWEEAHRKLAGLDIKHSKPIQSNLDAEEEILEKNLSRLVEDDDNEPKKAYASTGYKDIPTAGNLSSTWNGSPLSSPSDTLHDLINPSTNIWASPEHLSSKIDSNTSPTPPPGFPPKDKFTKRPFSPAFEDDAIVTAVPKPEALLPPSNFTKKTPAQAIRLEDLEKQLEDAKRVNQTPRQPFPMPGFSSNMMRTPQRYPNVQNVHSVMHRSPYQPYHQHIIHGTNSPMQSMGYGPNMPTLYSKVPLSAKTPPQMQRPIINIHSDPGHLWQNYHAPPHRARFSTPPHHIRNPENRYRDNTQNHNSNYHQTTDLERKIHNILNEETVNVKDPFAGLMTRREKEWIIKIQLLQLTSSNPDMDDFYFQTFMRRKHARERAKQGEGVECVSNKQQPTKMKLPDFERQQREYKPVSFKGTLGKLSASHVAHPREMVQVPHIHKDIDQDKQGSTMRESRRRRQMMSTIEKAFDLLLTLDDITNQQLHALHQDRSSLMENKQTCVASLVSLLKLSCEHDALSRGELISQLLSYRKGKVLISRLLQVFDQVEGELVLLAVSQNIVSIIKKDHQDQVLPLLIGPLSRVIEVTSMNVTLESFKSLVDSTSEPLSFVLSKQFGISILCCLIKRAATLKLDIDKSKEAKELWKTLISHLTKQFTDVPVKLLAKNLNGITPLVTVLDFCTSPSDLDDLHQHYRLALSTREEMIS